MAKICKEVWEKLFFAMLSGVLVVVFAVSGSAQERIRLSYSALSPSTAFLWIPKEKAFFKKHGLEVEILLIESGTLTSQALASGEIGIADNAGAPAIISNASGSGETIIMDWSIRWLTTSSPPSRSRILPISRTAGSE